MEAKTKLSLSERLARIQIELKSPKNIHNEFGNFNYRSCEGILEAVKPMLNGDLILLSDKILVAGDRLYVEATAKFTDGKDSIEVTALAREEGQRPKMSEPQLTGTASSYARKYALGGLLLIDDAKNDPDGMKNDEDKAKEPYKPAVPQTKPDIEGSKERLLMAIKDADTEEAVEVLENKYLATGGKVFKGEMAKEIEEALKSKHKLLN